MVTVGSANETAVHFNCYTVWRCVMPVGSVVDRVLSVHCTRDNCCTSAVTHCDDVWRL